MIFHIIVLRRTKSKRVHHLFEIQNFDKHMNRNWFGVYKGSHLMINDNWSVLEQLELEAPI